MNESSRLLAGNARLIRVVGKRNLASASSNFIPLLTDGGSLWRLFPHISRLGFSERHASNTTTHRLWILGQHKWCNEMIQERLVPTRPEQLSNPNKAIISLLLIPHPSTTHSLEHAITDTVHQPSIGNTCADIRQQLLANLGFIIALTKYCLLYTSPSPRDLH